MRSSTFALAFGLLAESTIAELDKPALYQNLEKFGPVLQSLPQTSPRNLWQWTDGRMPKGCRDEIIRNNRNPNDFEVFAAEFGDCMGEPWLICRENNAPYDIWKLVDDMSRLPVRMRQWIQNTIHFKDGGGAYNYAGFIGLYGDTVSTGVLFHESTHSVDWDGFTEYRLSNSQIWLDAYNADKAVPDNYARANQVENLAQFPGLIVYDRFTNGALREEQDIWKLGNQLNTVADQGDRGNQWGGRIFDLADTDIKCSFRYQPQAEVDRATGELRNNGKRDRERKRANGIVYKSPPDLATAVLSNCTSLRGLV